MKYAMHKAPQVMVSWEMPQDLAARLRIAAAHGNTTQRKLVITALEKHLPIIRVVVDKKGARGDEK